MKRYIFGLVILLSLAQFASAGTLGSLKESISAGRNLSVDLGSSPSGSWFVVNNSNPTVTNALIFGNKLVVSGLYAGTSNISACSDLTGANCLDLNVTINSVLGVSTGAHSLGSWVLSGTTVYYVSSAGLIPIPTWNIFLSNGGKQSLIQPANFYDLSLPMLPLMTAKDPRVK